MKCQRCEKIATFHITELTDPQGPALIHLCEDHAREFFQSSDGNLAELLAKQLQLEQAVQEIAESDNKQCPMCGLKLSEFRKGGRLGCPYDYVIFEEDLIPLLVNIHGAEHHVGKVPKNVGGAPVRRFRIKQLKQSLQNAIASENYEEAGRLRDRIKALEGGSELSDEDFASLEQFQAEPSNSPGLFGSLGSGPDLTQAGDENEEESDLNSDPEFDEEDPNTDGFNDGDFDSGEIRDEDFPEGLDDDDEDENDDR